MTATRSAAFTTTMRVINRVHGYTTNCRPNTTPTFGACFTQLAQIVFAVADFTYSCTTIDMNLAHFARTQP